MAKILLTSNGFFTEAIKKRFLEFIHGDISQMKATIITTASPQKGNNRYAQKAKEDFKEMGFKNIDFIDLEFDNPDILTQKDVIYISGGAILLGPHIKIVHFFTPQMNTLNIEDFTALNITGKLIFPHYDREDLFKDGIGKSIEDRLGEFEALEMCEVTRLKDDQFIAI